MKCCSIALRINFKKHIKVPIDFSHLHRYMEVVTFWIVKLLLLLLTPNKDLWSQHYIQLWKYLVPEWQHSIFFVSVASAFKHQFPGELASIKFVAVNRKERKANYELSSAYCTLNTLLEILCIVLSLITKII